MNEYHNPTNDLSQFGMIELEEAAKLLKAYQKGCDHLGDGVAVWFNKESGFVFLSDEDYNVAMLNGDELEVFYTCPECGHEGFLEEMPHEGTSHCQEYLDAITKEARQ